MSLGQGRGSKSTSRESPFAIKIRPVAGLNTRERRAQYTVVYENYMEKPATAQEKAHFNFLFPPRTFSLVRHWKRWGLWSVPPKRRWERTIPSRFVFPLAWDENSLPLRKKNRVCWPLRFDGKKKCHFPCLSKDSSLLLFPPLIAHSRRSNALRPYIDWAFACSRATTHGLA